MGVHNDCVGVLHNYSQVMVKIHHEVELFFVSYKALVPGNGLNFFNFQIVEISLFQSTDDLLKVKPPRL